MASRIYLQEIDRFLILYVLPPCVVAAGFATPAHRRHFTASRTLHSETFAMASADVQAMADPFKFDFGENSGQLRWTCLIVAVGFEDPVELKKKYLAERDKRARADGGDQYFIIGEPGTKGEKYAYWLTDPWTPRVERAPVKEEVQVLLLGAGFSGIMSAAMLKEHGVTDLRIVDAAGGFGGTWVRVVGGTPTEGSLTALIFPFVR